MVFDRARGACGASHQTDVSAYEEHPAAGACSLLYGARLTQRLYTSGCSTFECPKSTGSGVLGAVVGLGQAS